MRRIAALILITLTMSACANTGLVDLQNDSGGPDEFLAQPVNALEAPASYTELPPPTPGQGNRTDRSAVNEGIVAFGGTPTSPDAGIPASDSALIQHASRRGVDPNIRQELAEADAKFRKRRGRFTQIRIGRVDRYEQVYRRQALDPHAESAKWRRAGARTPSSPPAR